VTLPVFVVDADALAFPEVEVGGDEARHAVTVRRIRPGERVLLTDGVGNGAECAVRTVSSSLLRAEVLVRHVEPLPSPRLVVVQALVKGNAGESAVDLMTQVGVDVVVPWGASRSVVSWSGEPGSRGTKALQRWRSAAREAGKQSRRLRFPSVQPLNSTEEIIALLHAAKVAVVLHEAAATPAGELSPPTAGDLVVVVGPEGGLTDDEVETFAAAGARSVRLGRSVIRASAAGAVAAGVLLSRTPRWS
jgi:16S rRNA (uracil1498-N3)-methyltransferase